MRHHIFTEAENYSVAVLIKGTSFNKKEIENNYINPMISKGIQKDAFIAFTLKYNDEGKASVKFIKEYLELLLPMLESVGVKYLYVADSSYFKILTGQSKAEPHFGYVLPCKVKGFEHIQVALGVNYQALIYNPTLQDKLNMGLDAIAAKVSGTYTAIGTGIIHSSEYPTTVGQIAAALEKLHQYPAISADIEAFSLSFDKAGIGTIAFAWDEHNGIAFACDYAEVWLSGGFHDPVLNDREYDTVDIAACHGFNKPNKEVRALLLKFFTTYKGEITWHHSPYDLKAIIYALWMDNLLDRQGMLSGLDVMTNKMHDTKVIAYLATNSTAGNNLGLKPLAHEFAGNWAVEEIKDIRKIPLPELLQYNLVDALSTQYVKKKYWPIMVQDSQLELYQSLMMPSQKAIIQMELVGLPLSASKVQEVKGKLEAIQTKHKEAIQQSKLIKLMNMLLTDSEWENDYESRKAKAKNPHKILPKDRSTFPDKVFNPNSGPQLQKLLYEQMGLPILDRTDTQQPATGADTIEKLINHTQEPEYKAILEALIGYGKVSKILNTFIPAFEKALVKGSSDTVWLHGSFNLGGTVSGRLSSSDPNLQNIPANSLYGKLIKECFVAPEGWLFSGADFNSLEDYISALTTKDPNKLKVYAGSKQFDLTINGITHRIREEDVVSYDGQKLTGNELYEKLHGCKPRDLPHK